MSQKGEYSDIGAMFANHILQLGGDGFADWLLKSFGGPEPGHEPGWFMIMERYRDQGWFDDEMQLVVGEFEDDVLTVARKAVAKAVENLPTDASKEGREVLANLATMFQ